LIEWVVDYHTLQEIKAFKEESNVMRLAIIQSSVVKYSL
jgi:hypothetical protein